MNYYSQFGEDKVIIEEYFKDFTGGCIDIGASNGISINNTLALEETGWYCMCVEPNPTYFTELKENRYNAVNYAISDRNDELIFKIVNIGNGVEEAMSALTLDERLIQQHRDYGYPINITPIVVQAVTLDECIKRHYEFDTIDFISIDTEGTELDILKGFDIERWQPKLMIIENNFNDDDIEIYLSLFDYYKERRLGVNDFYVKKKDSYAE